MNEQEMQFADPDWRPGGGRSPVQDTAGVPQPVNGNGYDMSRTVVTPPDSRYNAGYTGLSRQMPPSPPPSHFTPPLAGQTPLYSPPSLKRRSSPWWAWVLVIFALIALISGMNAFSSSRSFSSPNPGFGHYNPFDGSGHQPRQGQRTYGYTLPADATQLQIVNPAGSIIVQSGGSGQELSVASDDTEDGVIVFQDEGGTIVVNVNPSEDADDTNIVVTLPSTQLQLNLSTKDNNDIEVDNYTGQLVAQSDEGEITVEGGVLSGNSSLQTQDGDIDLKASSITGPAKITSSSGSIGIDAALSGDISVATGSVGEISMDGTLDPQGTYQFTTTEGDIQLTLPHDTAMQLQYATGPDGSYQSDFFSVTGGSPRAQVTVDTSSGSITIHNQDR